MKTKILFLLFTLIFLLKEVNPLYLLAVNNESAFKIKFNVYLVENKDNKVDVYYSSPSFVSPDTQFSIKLARDVVCSIFSEKCKNYDFLVKINSDSPVITGPSGGAAFAVGMIMALFNLPDKDVGITGTINPGGIIGPVGGVDRKVEYSLDLEKIIIPLGQKNYRDPLTNKTVYLNYPNVYEAGTIFEAVELIWGVKFNFKLNNLTIPSWYKDTMQNIAISLCNKVGKEVNNESDFYSQASFCFRELNKKFLDNYEEKDKNYLINRSVFLKKELDELKKNIKEKIGVIEGLNELQLYMILYKRIKDAEQTLEKIREDLKKQELVQLLSYAEARIVSIKEWSKFLDVIPKGIEIDENKLFEMCKSNFKFVETYYKQLLGLIPDNLFLPFFEKIENNKKILDYYYSRDPVLCIAYSKELKSTIDYLFSLIYSDQNLLPTFFNNTNKIVEFYLKLNKEFPIMAYSYWKYANEIVKKEKDYYLAINYNYLAMNLATMIYEITEEENNKVKVKEEILVKAESKVLDSYYFVYILIAFVILFYLIVTRNLFKF